MPQISVIVPVYQVEEYLPVCVDSILTQTFTDFELILVDDGSPDCCGKLCDAYAAQDGRIRVIHRENGGLSAARNSGMDIAAGEYVTFIDSDDMVAAAYLERLYAAAREHAADISVCAFQEFENGEHISSAESAEGMLRCSVLNGKEACLKIYAGSREMPINACGKLFRRDLIGGDRFPEGRLHEDQAFVPPVCFRARRVARVNQTMYFYRIRPESITRTKFSLKRYDDLWAIDNCIRFFMEQGETEIVAKAEKKRKRLLCVYSIYAKRDGVNVPPEYRVRMLPALRYLRKNVSDQKYAYYLAQLNPRYACYHEYLRRIGKAFSATQKHSEKSI